MRKDVLNLEQNLTEHNMYEFSITRENTDLKNKRVTRFQSHCKRSIEKWIDEGNKHILNNYESIFNLKLAKIN